MVGLIVLALKLTGSLLEFTKICTVLPWYYRGVVRTGSKGAFAPVNSKQRVLRTHPEKKISMKSMKTIEKLMQKSGKGSNCTPFFEEGGKIPTLKKSCTCTLEP